MVTKRKAAKTNKVPKIDLSTDGESRPKSPRTLLLDDENFRWLQGYCAHNRTKPSHLLDTWIARLRTECGEP